MIESVASLLSTSLSYSWSTDSSTSSSSTYTSFGPDYLLSILDAQTSTLGAAYDSTGAAVVPPSSSPAGVKRIAALEEALSLLGLGKTAEARAAAQTVLRTNQGDPVANYLIGRAYVTDGDYVSAEPYWARVAAGDPDNEQAQSDLRAVQILQRGEGAAVSEVKRLLANPTTAEAGARLAGYVSDENPGNIEVRIALADYYEANDSLSQAGIQYVAALTKVTPDDANRLATRLERFAHTHSDDPAAHDLLARGYAAAGRLPEAEAEFSRALQLSNGDLVFQNGVKRDFSEIYTRFGREALARGDEAGARAHFDRALQLNRDDTRKADVVDLETKAGERAMRQGLTNAVLRAFGKAAANLPTADEDKDERRQKLIDNYTLLGSKLNATGDLKRAVAARDGAYQLDLGDEALRRKLADAHDVYGLSLYEAGKYREALKQFKAAVKLFDDDETYAQHLEDAQGQI